MSELKPLNDLGERWRAEAVQLRTRYGDEQKALLCEAHAKELDDQVRLYLEEELPVHAAATESGYSVSQLRRMLQADQLKDVGDEHETRFRRGDLPRKVRRRPVSESQHNELQTAAVGRGDVDSRARAAAQRAAFRPAQERPSRRTKLRK